MASCSPSASTPLKRSSKAEARLHAVYAARRQAEHFAMLDGAVEPVASRFVLVVRDSLGDGYVTSWDVLEDARKAVFPLEPGLALIDTKTYVYWTHEGIFQ